LILGVRHGVVSLKVVCLERRGDEREASRLISLKRPGRQ
jgi:hypothetical protein